MKRRRARIRIRLPAILFASLFCLLLAPRPALAIFTELGLSYNYKKLNFDDQNSLETQGATGSIAFYVWERIALELAYTNSLLVKKESELATPGSTSVRTTVQKADIYELTGQFLLNSNRQGGLQPYIKAGVAYINKSQRIQIDNTDPPPPIAVAGWGPSAGVGLKYFFTENLSIRLSYDVVRTPVDTGSTADDITGRAGISWLF
ncbi:MAG: porin family protein [Bdellovibrio sp.]|nr:MAG: porin family protein [Bdellovibrio sp.]